MTDFKLPRVYVILLIIINSKNILIYIFNIRVDFFDIIIGSMNQIGALRGHF